MLYIEAKANQAIGAWETLLSGLPSRVQPAQTNGAYQMNVSDTVVACNLTTSGVLNSPASIANNANVRFFATYICANE